METENLEDELLVLISKCNTPEELQIVLKQYFRSSGHLVVTKVITVTYACKLCGSHTARKEVVEATKTVFSHTLAVLGCGECKRQLLYFEKEELIELLLNTVRFGNPRPEVIQARKDSYDYDAFRHTQFVGEARDCRKAESEEKVDN